MDLPVEFSAKKIFPGELAQRVDHPYNRRVGTVEPVRRR